MMRQIPPITKNLIIINVICFLVAQVFTSLNLNSMLGLHYFQAQNFQIWQFVTYMFMHDGWMHIFFNMFALWMFGGLIERTFGQQRYLAYYLVCGLGAALCQEVSQFVQVYAMIAEQGATLSDMFNLSAGDRMALNAFTTVGASGSIYGILLAFGMTYPEEKMFVFPVPFPIKAKWFVVGYAVIELWLAFSNARGATDGIAHVAHLGGMLFGYLLIRYWRTNSSSFNGWDGYEVKQNAFTRFIDSVKKNFSNLFNSSSKSSSSSTTSSTTTSGTSSRRADWDYNARRNAQKTEKEKEIDAILDKIRQSGYSALTEAEKKKLFEAGQ